MCNKKTSHFLTYLSSKVKIFAIFAILFGVFFTSALPFTSVIAKPAEKPIKKTEQTEQTKKSNHGKTITTTNPNTFKYTTPVTPLPAITVPTNNQTGNNHPSSKNTTDNQKSSTENSNTTDTKNANSSDKDAKNTKSDTNNKDKTSDSSDVKNQASPDSKDESSKDKENTDKKSQNPESSNSKDEKPNESKDSQSSDAEKKGCSDHIVGIGWLICPIINLAGSGIDAMYGLINNFLIVKPIFADKESSILTIWQYFRDVTNIIFIIFFLVIIYSQITGIGFNNYQIKRTLPRVVVAAILINLSFIICSLALDISNILGSSLRGVFTSIEENVIKNYNYKPDDFNWASFIATIVIGGGVAYKGIIIAGGLMSVLWMSIPVILGAVIAVVAGLFTIAGRQAVIYLLVMISPLAFVAYLLPNTEKYFDKWKALFTKMLIFYPMFSVLFGASSLAGWAIISSADNIFVMILGMAVRIFPLFYSVKLMQMSDTILSNISNSINRLSKPLVSKVSTESALRAAKARADYYTRGAINARRGTKFSFLDAGARSHKRTEDRKKMLENSAKRAEAVKNSYQSVALNANDLGLKMVGIDKDGREIYKSDTRKVTKSMQEAYGQKAAENRAKASGLMLEKEFDAMGDFLEHGNFDKTSKAAERKFKQMEALKNQNFQSFIDNTVTKSAIESNERADARFLHEEIRKASQLDKNGNPIDPAKYNKLIKEAAGYDALNDDNDKISNDALMRVTAKSFEAADAEDAATVKKYAAYAKRQNTTEDVIDLFRNAIKSKNAEAIVAFGQEIANRGDLDKFSKPLAEALDEGDYIQLDDDFSSKLAHLFLSMKGIDPTMQRFGKHIMVENALFKAGDRKNKFVTMREFFTGEYEDENGNIVPTKGSAADYLKGTPFKDMDRTAIANLEQYINSYLPGEENHKKREAIYNAMLPQIISAMGSFASGSEQIVHTMNHITGVKKNKNGNWEKANKMTSVTSQEFTERTKDYLGALTAEAIINMKSDTIESIIEKFKLDATDLGINDKVAAQKYAEQQYANSFNDTAIEILKRTPNIASMKPKNLKILEDTGRI